MSKMLTLEELLGIEVGSSDFDLIPEGDYNGAITGAEVKSGPKGPYIKVEVTIHDEGYRGRKVWRQAASFSEKALTMPGAAPNLVQATQPELSPGLEVGELPAAIADAILSTAVTISVTHDQVKRDGKLAFNSDGTPEFRAQINAFSEASDEFKDSFQAEKDGVDDDLPF
jgi:hypothetical protein